MEKVLLYKVESDDIDFLVKYLGLSESDIRNLRYNQELIEATGEKMVVRYYPHADSNRRGTIIFTPESMIEKYYNRIEYRKDALIPAVAKHRSQVLHGL